VEEMVNWNKVACLTAMIGTGFYPLSMFVIFAWLYIVDPEPHGMISFLFDGGSYYPIMNIKLYPMAFINTFMFGVVFTVAYHRYLRIKQFEGKA